MSGINTLDDLRDRCRIDEDTGCWHWCGAVNGEGQPSLWLPAAKRRVTLGRAIGWLKTGSEPPPKLMWFCVCDTKHCANPAHRRKGTKSDAMLAAGLTKSPLTRARMTEARRRRSTMTAEKAAEIRASAEPLAVIAERHGISITHACAIRRGKRWAALNIAPSASVFSFAAASSQYVRKAA